MNINSIIKNSDGSANIELYFSPLELETVVIAGFTKILEDYMKKNSIDEGTENASEPSRDRGSE